MPAMAPRPQGSVTANPKRGPCRMSSGAALPISMRERPLGTPRSSLASPIFGGRTGTRVTNGLDLRKSTTAARQTIDPLASAGAAVAWMILANKPLYPVTVWLVVGGGIEASLTTLIAAPLYAAVPFLARRAPLLARAATPAIGLADTLLATKVFGRVRGRNSSSSPAACSLLCPSGGRRSGGRGASLG